MGLNPNRERQWRSAAAVRFNIELNPSETMVSWKKLLKKANLSEADRPGPSARARLLKPVPTP